ncbi:DUF2231 domain-containing protein [uncultured Bacteroides sp.]|uniref:DUF2231 domain-containing protein n=2 Tax=uncultured Bacteroides sp. TaxID=162156 RepID=UPI00344AF08B
MFDTSHIHPMLVHFPIALTLLGVLFEGFYLFRSSQFRYPCGELILYFATISALSAAVSSSLFTLDFTNPELAQIKNIYSAFAGITVILLCITSAIYLTMTFIGCYIPRFSAEMERRSDLLFPDTGNACRRWRRFSYQP